MNIEINHTTNIFDPTLTKRLRLPATSPQKIAYRTAPTNQPTLNIQTRENKPPHYTPGKLTLPQKMQPSTKTYYLRSTLNHEHDKQDNLSLHAAYLQTPEIDIILTGPSKSGKSTVSFTAQRRGHRVIGDDHIILSSKHVFGNRNLRLRQNNTILPTKQYGKRNKTYSLIYLSDDEANIHKTARDALKYRINDIEWQDQTISPDAFFQRSIHHTLDNLETLIDDSYQGITTMTLDDAKDAIKNIWT